MSNKKFWVSPCVLWLFVLLMFSFPVSSHNTQLFIILNSLNSNLSDSFWLSMTTLGDGLLLGIILGMFVIVNPRITAFGLILILSSSVAVNTMKSVLPELRPAAVLADVHIVGPIMRSGSFPSGHSAAALATALALARFSPSRTLKTILLIFGILVGLSRIFVGAHFPNDVIWGMIVSLALYEILSEFVWPRIEWYVPDIPLLDNNFFRTLLALEVATASFCLVIYSQVFAEYPPVAIAVSSGVLTFFVAAFIKLVRHQ
jgi:membrane-associated phospholipid phosphatase